MGKGSHSDSHASAVRTLVRAAQRARTGRVMSWQLPYRYGRMDQSVPPCAEGVNLISTSTEVPQASIVQASVQGVFDRPVPEITRVSRTCTRLQPAAVPRPIIAATDAP